MRSLLISLYLLLVSGISLAGDSVPLESYLNERGEIDMSAVRASGFEGSLETGGRSVVIDPDSGRPMFLTSATDKTNSDEPWAEGFDLPGFDGSVNSICVFQGEIYVGGQFRTYGSVDCDNLAVYDGVSWQGFEERFGYSMGEITCMVVHDGRLVIGGDVGVDGPYGYSRYIVGFDGSQLLGYSTGFSGKPNALLDFNGSLIAGGNLWYTGNQGTTLKHLAIWTGVAWAAYGVGMNGVVQALCEHEGDLIIGGRFSTANDVGVNGIARWTGTTFEPVSGWTGSAYNNIKALLSHDGFLYAGGDFTSVEGRNAENFANWDGTKWAEVGHGITSSESYCFVETLKEFGGDILVGGRFQRAGSLTTSGVVVWNGGSFEDMAGGVAKPGFSGGVTDAIDWNGAWWVVGWFSTAGSQSANRIALWDGAAWSQAPETEGAGVDSSVYALCMYNGDLIAGGQFLTAGSTLANRIARWDGSVWHPMGEGFDDRVTALVVWNGDLVASGEFLYSGGIPLRHIASWDGSSWHDMSGGVSAEADIMVEALGGLYVGGLLSDAGGTPVQNIARWNGTIWSNPGGGADGRVRSMLPHDGELLVGGDFLNAGGNPAAHLARWNGASWSEFAGGADGNVYALAYYNGVVAGGEFLNLGGVPCSRIGRWDGMVWDQLGAGFVPQECVPVFPDDWDCWNIFVTHMAVSEGRLYVNGVTQSGSLPLVNLACWTDFEHWTPLGSGLSSAYAICADQQKLWVGGGFNPLSGNPAYCLTSWDIDRIPTPGDELWWSGFDELGMDNDVWSFAQFGGELVAAGYFNDAGGVAVPGVASWNGSTWTPLGDGFGRFGLNRPLITSLVEWNGSLYASGLFSLPPATDDVSFARWDGSQWLPLMYAIYPQRVYELVPYGNDLMLIGSFAEIDGQPASGLAAYDGLDFTIIPAAATLSGTSPYKGGAAVYQGNLVVHGRFDTIEGVPCENLARWDGASWLPGTDGFGVTWEVRDVVVNGGDLYAGGSITAAGGLPAGAIAKWNGLAWNDLGGGLGRYGGYDPKVETLGLANGEVVATGYFETAGGAPCSYGIASWNGVSWNSYGSGFVLNTGAIVRAITVWDSDLYLGGDFNITGDKNSANIARWFLPDPSGTPGPVPGIRTMLQAVRPNPFNPSTTAPFELARATHVTLAIHDVRGRRIRTLIDAPLKAASYRAHWDGRDDHGMEMPSGIYFMRLQAGDEVLTNKMMLVR